MTDFEKFCYAFLVVCGFSLAIGFSWRIAEKRGYRKGYDAALSLPHKADTVWRDTTIYKEHLVEVVKWKEREKTVLVPVHDSTLVTIHDTTYVALEREFKRYSDEDYEAQVSGVDPTLDWIKINQKTAYITNTVVKKQRWAFGVTAGPGVVFNGKVHGGVGVVAGVSYNF